MTGLRRVIPVAACALPLLLAGCGVSPEGQARALDPNAGPYRVVTQNRAVPPAGSHPVAIFLVRDGALISTSRRIPEQPNPANVLKALSSGPSAAEKAKGLTTGLPPDRDVTVRSVDGGTVTVSLPQSADSSNRSDAVLAFGQVVLTLVGLPTVTGVLFEQNGQALQVPRADGSLSTAPLTRADYQRLIARG